MPHAGVPTPNEADSAGHDYAFEKGAEKVGGGDGFADVWKRGRFAWEYKGKRKNLNAAYQQLLQYREALESPPLLVGRPGWIWRMLGWTTQSMPPTAGRTHWTTRRSWSASSPST